MIKKVLLVGGSGYLGTAIAKRFARDDDFDLTVGDFSEPQIAGQKFIKFDVMDRASVNSYIKEYDLIINCIGQITSPINACFNINTYGIDNIIHAIHAYKKKIIHISTLAVYGTTSCASEISPINPESPYAACKAFAEYKITSQLPEESFCILRLANLYGENQQKGLFAYLLRSYLSGEKLQFNNNGTLTRYFLHVSDCANGVFWTVRNNLIGVYNVASNDKYSIIEIISLIENTCKNKFITEFENLKPIENIDRLNADDFWKASQIEPQLTISKFINNTFSKYVQRN